MLNRSYGVMVSTLDFESSDPSSNLGKTSQIFFYQTILKYYGYYFTIFLKITS